MRAEMQNNLQNALSDLKVKEYENVINDIVNQCCISKSTLYRWVKNPKKIKQPFKVIISNIFKADINDLFKS